MSEANAPTENPPPVYAPRTPERIVKDGKVLLFRYDNPNFPSKNPDSRRPDLVGSWFTDSPRQLGSYILMRPPGGDIVIAAIPEDKVDSLHVFNHPVAKDMDVENDNYIIPDELLTDAKRVKLEVEPSNPASKKFNIFKDAEGIRTFLNGLIETERSQ